MRLIDADIMEKFIEEQAKDETDWLINQYNLDWIYSFVEAQPTIETRPVIHGHWIEKKMPFDYVMCSACEIGVPFETDYCPSCGAKMDEVIDNEIN